MTKFLKRNEGWVVAALFIAVFLVGCVVLQPKNFEEKVAAAYTSVSTVRALSLTASQANKISVDELKTVHEQANHFRAGIEAARKLKLTDPKTSAEQLQAIIDALAYLQIYLETK